MGRQAYRDVLANARRRRPDRCKRSVGGIGNWLYNAALLAYVYADTHSATWVGAATICRLLPYMLLGPLGGAIAEQVQPPKRPDRRRPAPARTHAWSHGGRSSEGAGAGGDRDHRPRLSSEHRGATGVSFALLPRLVRRRDRLGSGVALLHGVQELGVVGGPGDRGGAAGGWAELAGVPGCNAATFATSAVLVSSIRDRWRPQRIRGNTRSHVRQGVRAARTTQFVVPLFFVAATVEFIYGAQTVQLVVYARDSLGLCGDRRIWGTPNGPRSGWRHERAHQRTPCRNAARCSWRLW